MLTVYRIRGCHVHGTVLKDALTCQEAYKDDSGHTIYCDNGEEIGTISVGDHQRVVKRLEKALHDVKFHTGLGEARDGTIAEIRKTVDDALASLEKIDA